MARCFRARHKSRSGAAPAPAPNSESRRRTAAGCARRSMLPPPRQNDASWRHRVFRQPSRRSLRSRRRPVVERIDGHAPKVPVTRRSCCHSLPACTPWMSLDAERGHSPARACAVLPICCLFIRQGYSERVTSTCPAGWKHPADWSNCAPQKGTNGHPACDSQPSVFGPVADIPAWADGRPRAKRDWNSCHYNEAHSTVMHCLTFLIVHAAPSAGGAA